MNTKQKDVIKLCIINSLTCTVRFFWSDLKKKIIQCFLGRTAPCPPHADLPSNLNAIYGCSRTFASQTVYLPKPRPNGWRSQAETGNKSSWKTQRSSMKFCTLMGRKHKQKPIREHGTYICCRTALIRWRWTIYMDLGLGLLLVLAKTNLNMGSASNFPMNSNSMKPIFLFYSNSLCPFKRKYITIKTTIICFLVFGQRQRQHTGCSRL